MIVDTLLETLAHGASMTPKQVSTVCSHTVSCNRKMQSHFISCRTLCYTTILYSLLLLLVYLVSHCCWVLSVSVKMSAIFPNPTTSHWQSFDSWTQSRQHLFCLILDNHFVESCQHFTSIFDLTCRNIIPRTSQLPDMSASVKTWPAQLCRIRHSLSRQTFFERFNLFQFLF